MSAQRNHRMRRQKNFGKGSNKGTRVRIAFSVFSASEQKSKEALQRGKGNRGRPQVMGWCFDRRGLAPFFTGAPPRTSLPGKTKICSCDRRE